jgi:hypothetical protein
MPIWNGSTTGLTQAEAEAAAAAAITAANLPSDLGVEAACTSALDVKFPRIPNTSFGPFGGTPLTGSTSYAIIAATTDYYGVLYGVIITASAPCNIRFKSSGGANLGANHNLIAGVPFSPSAMLPVQSLYRSNLDEGITLAVSDAGVTLQITFWGGLVYGF